MRIELYIEEGDRELRRVLDQLVKHGRAIVSTNTSIRFIRKKKTQLRRLRENGYLYFGNDRRFGISIITVSPLITIKKEKLNNGFKYIFF